MAMTTERHKCDAAARALNILTTKDKLICSHVLRRRISPQSPITILRVKSDSQVHDAVAGLCVADPIQIRPTIAQTGRAASNQTVRVAAPAANSTLNPEPPDTEPP
jgi:hypothetical protein